MELEGETLSKPTSKENEMTSEAIQAGQGENPALPVVDTWLSDCRILLVHSDALVGVLVQRALSLLVDEVITVARSETDFDETFDDKFDLAIVDMSANTPGDHQALVRMLRKLKDADIAMVAMVDDQDIATAGLAAGFRCTTAACVSTRPVRSRRPYRRGHARRRSQRDQVSRNCADQAERIGQKAGAGVLVVGSA